MTPATAPVTTAHPLRVVVVDDVADVRRVVRAALERHAGFEVVGEASDGAEAVDVAAALAPDVVLLDLDMPHVSGVEALPALRRVAPGAKIVVLSGLPRRRHEGATRAGGAIGYIEKGIRAGRLVGDLLTVIGLLEAVDGAIAERQVELACATGSPRAARRFVGDTLRQWDVGVEWETVELLVSEVVTNAMIHARTDAEVAVVLQRDVVRIEVGDRSDDPPRPRDAVPHGVSGRGVKLVAALASAWGVDRGLAGGKVVWFELPRLDQSAAPAGRR